ncbi:unnamed protein product [Pedinophyceae sp. YPF-701]|nr:unnamed protein product [Pedinophyceae sp. YPF-701]
MWQRRIVFAPLAGELWGHAGSRRLVYELENGSPKALNITGDQVDIVIDLGLLGRVGRTGVTLHTAQGSAFADSSNLAAGLSAALEQNGLTTSTEQGVPTISPAQTFLAMRSSIRVVSLNDFGSSIDYAFLGSSYDTDGAVLPDYDALGNVACSVAKYLLDETRASQAGAEAVECGAAPSYVRQWAGCLNQGAGSADCRALTADLLQLIGTTPGFPGILQNGADVDGPRRKTDIARLFWNAFGRYFGTPTERICDQLGNNPCQGGEQCIGWLHQRSFPDGAGTCTATSVQYVPGYSPRLQWDPAARNGGGWWTVRATAQIQRSGGVDHAEDDIFTESYWPKDPEMEFYLKERESTDVAVLAVSVVMTVLIGGMIVLTERSLARAGGHLQDAPPQAGATSFGLR